MGLFKLSVQDFIKGFIVAVLTTIVTALIPILETGALPDLATLKALGLTGLAAGLAYLVKNFLTNEDDKFLNKI